MAIRWQSEAADNKSCEMSKILMFNAWLRSAKSCSSFNSAAPPAVAQPLIEALMADLSARGFRVAGGRFGASMQVALVGDGPVTLVLDVKDGRVA